MSKISIKLVTKQRQRRRDKTIRKCQLNVTIRDPTINVDLATPPLFKSYYSYNIILYTTLVHRLT